MTNCKGCFKDALWGIGLVALGTVIVWAQLTQDLTVFGTIKHVRDGQVKENPICTIVLIMLAVLLLLVVMVRLRQAERRAIEAGDLAERSGYADPLPGVTRKARAGYGTVLIILGLVALPIIFGLAWLAGGS